ncbi:MAG: YbaB/EbfC family nucleoid-associated protein [Bacilli bacterium]|nr:YbaB/EbfC family nucleoid-associated protein [Bacilli bacterium]
MNIQAMMKQAQKMQKDMLKSKEEIDNTIFEGKSSFVSVEMKGTKELTKVKIDQESLDKDEIEMLEDMILVAVNEANKKVDQVTEEKMGKYTSGMPGLF